MASSGNPSICLSLSAISVAKQHAVRAEGLYIFAASFCYSVCRPGSDNCLLAFWCWSLVKTDGSSCATVPHGAAPCDESILLDGPLSLAIFRSLPRLTTSCVWVL